MFHFLVTLAETVGSSDQMNNPPTWILNTTCNLLTRKGDIVANFAAAYMFNVGDAGATACNNFQASAYINALKNTSVAATQAGESCVAAGSTLPLRD